MLSPILTPAVLRSEAGRYAKVAWRLVEAQHIDLTLKVVNHVEDQNFFRISAKKPSRKSRRIADQVPHSGMDRRLAPVEALWDRPEQRRNLRPDAPPGSERRPRGDLTNRAHPSRYRGDQLHHL